MVFVVSVEAVSVESSSDRGMGKTSLMERLSVIIGAMATVEESWLTMESS